MAILLFNNPLWGAETEIRLLLFKKPLNKKQQQQLKQLSATIGKIAPFTPYRSDYFSRLYSLEMSSEQRRQQRQFNWGQIQAIAPIENIEVPLPVTALSIHPSPNAAPLTNDPLVTFQWALNSDGQKVVLPNGTSIDSEYINAVPNSDFKIKSIIGEIESKIKQDLIVAVIDFGLDYHHPDIVNNIAYNPEECDLDASGKIYKNRFRPKDDRDGNGYKGDCLGWNFFGKDDPQKNNNPMDDMGHGTHVAGIIAAEKDNGLGISGISNRLKVLPIKVMGRKSGEGEDDSSGGDPLTDRVAKGILYAITRKVDVINLSLGWASSMDHQHIRQAVKEAIDQGIMIVAAAGNNQNNRPIAPCNYPEVICVGSSRIDKKVSSFSNFGGHIDLLAPGDQILSLFPHVAHNSDRPNLFNIPGYEIKSGTSQAAPMIAAAAALLKGALGIDPDEVKARLFSSAENLLDKDKYFRGGLINIERAYHLTPRSVVRPEFKDLELLKVNSVNGSFEFPLVIKNYWTQSWPIQVTVSSESPGLTIGNRAFTLAALGPGETDTINIAGRVVGNKSIIPNTAKFTVSLGNQQSYSMEFILAQALDNQQGLENVKIVLDDEMKQEMDKITNLKTSRLPIRTITDLKRLSSTPEYYFVGRNPEQKMKIKILQRIENRYQITREIVIPQGQLLMSFQRKDFEQDGTAEYIIRTGHYDRKQRQTFIYYTFLDHQFNPYYGHRHSTWEFKVERDESDNRQIMFQPKDS